MTEPPSERSLRRELEAYYRPLLPHWDRTLAGRGDLDFWRGVIRERPGRDVLELGAGSGRVTEVLAGGSGRVVAVDLLPAALHRARERLPAAGRVLTVAADMRTLRLDARFGLVAAANDPFSHLRSDEGRRRALERVAGHLERDGRFLLDALWFPDAWLAEARGPDGKTSETSVPAGEPTDEGGRGGTRDLRVRQTWRCRPETRLCEAAYELHRGGRRVARSTFRGRYWDPDELESSLRRAGLEIERRWGDYARSDWTPASEHLVVSARPARDPAGLPGGP